MCGRYLQRLRMGEEKRRKKEDRKKKKPQDKSKMACPISQGGNN